MKGAPARGRERLGFTLIELLAAMAITAMIVSMLVAVASSALEGWRVSRNEVSVSREAQAALDIVSRDLESLVWTRGNDFDWLVATNQGQIVGPSGAESPNASRLLLLTAAVDRYNGALTVPDPKQGNVSAVGYSLHYRDPIMNDQREEGNLSFVLYRQLIDPDETFNTLIGQQDMQAAYSGFIGRETMPQNYVCEDIFQFSISFTVEYEQNGQSIIERIPVLAVGGASANDFRLRGNGIQVNGNIDNAYAQGRVLSADISITVLGDAAAEAIRKGVSGQALENVLKKHTSQFSRTVMFTE